MPAARVADALRSLTRDADRPADGDLLARFVAGRDEAAFAELIRRHGPTVLGVCRRVLGHAHDAEDAFQAVWLVLARRAADVHPPGSVGNFLYGVAVRTATKARALAARRRLKQMSAAKPDLSEDPPAVSDLQAVLDEELARLPDKYRAAVVLCDVAGKSRSAAELGCPEGTLATRQAKGRALLADRLRRRGITLSAGGLAAALAPEALAASVPATLAADALAAAVGRAAVSPSAQLLAEGVMRSLTLARWKLPAALLLAFGLAGGVVLASLPTEQPAPRGERPVVPLTEKIAAPARPVNLAWKEAATLDLPGWLAGSVAYSRGGELLIVGGTGGHVRAYDAATRKTEWDHKDEAGHFAAVAVSPDGNGVAITTRDGVKLLSIGLAEFVAALDEKDSRPTAVAWFADRPLGPGLPKVFKLVFGSANGYFIKNWVDIEKPGTIQTSTVPPGKEPADPWAVPLAADRRANAEAHAIMTGPIDRETGKNVLWAYAAGGPGGNHLLEGHKATVISAAWSADGKTAATGDADGVVILWDGDTFREKTRAKLAGRVAALALTADGKRVAAAVIELPTAQDRPSYHERVFVWDAGRTPKDPPALPVANDQPFGGPFQGTAGLAFSPDGKELAAGFCNTAHLLRTGKLIGRVHVWALAAGR